MAEEMLNLNWSKHFYAHANTVIGYQRTVELFLWEDSRASLLGYS